MQLKHLTIRTRRLEESVYFYTETAGLTELRRITAGGKTIVFLGNAEGETELELMEVDRGAVGPDSGLSVGFVSGDVELYHRCLSERGLEPSPIVSPAPGVEFFFVKDPNGLDVQFM